MSQTTAYRKFAEMMLHRDSEYIPKILRCMITEEQAELLVSLPGSTAQMAEKSGREVDAVRTDLNDMFCKVWHLKRKKMMNSSGGDPVHLPAHHAQVRRPRGSLSANQPRGRLYN